MKPSTLRTLRLLERNDSATTHDFLVAGCGSRFGARIGELRELGYRIAEQRLTDGRSGSRYTLLSGPEDVLPQVPATPACKPVNVSAQTSPARSRSSTGPVCTVPEGPDQQLGMFEVEVKRMSHYDQEAA